MRHDWWKTFFDEQIGDFMFGRISSIKTVAEVKTILRNSKLRQKGDILDLACGRGRHSIEFARRKYSVIGFDYSKAYLEKAQRLARVEKVQDHVSFVRGDMRRLSPLLSSESFDLVVSLYNSFGYFSKRSDDQRVLNEAAQVLKPGGFLVLNTLNHAGVEHRLCSLPTSAGLAGLDRWEQHSRKEFLLDRARYDVKRREIRVDWHFLDLKAGKNQTHSFRQNVYSTEDLEKMLKKAGFSIVKRWGRLDGEKFRRTSWHQTVLAKKIR